MNFSKKLDEILVNFFNEAEEDVHSDNFNSGTVYTKAGTKAKQALTKLIIEAQLEEVKGVPYTYIFTTGGDNHDTELNRWKANRIDELEAELEEKE